jgi:hypothetical protein
MSRIGRSQSGPAHVLNALSTDVFSTILAQIAAMSAATP